MFALISVSLGWCPHVARGDLSVRIKKSTTVRTNVNKLSELRKSCCGGHSHFHCLGSVISRETGRRVSVAREAGRYPAKLCSSWARAVVDCVHDLA